MCCTKQFLTSEKLPPYGKDVLVWHPQQKVWTIGFLHKVMIPEHGDYFRNTGTGAWYLKDGVTMWQELPKKPRLPKQIVGRNS